MKPVTLFGPDFPFDYDEWIKHPAGLGVLPEAVHGPKLGSLVQALRALSRAMS